jgi:hypothetical protein
MSYDKILMDLETRLFTDSLYGILSASLRRAEENWRDEDHVRDAAWAFIPRL